MPIKNIIFDLGGVIINLDQRLTVQAFRELGAINIDEIYSQKEVAPFFDDYEMGKISSATFRELIKSKLDVQASDEKLDAAWNAMLLDIPSERLEFIKQLRSDYQVFLFSNTNEIHLQAVHAICSSLHGSHAFSECFDKEYYSHTLGKRKPHPESFLAILADSGLNGDETLFIDDSLQNVLGAREAGLHAMHLSKEKTLRDILGVIDEINQCEIKEREGVFLLK